MSTEKSVSQEGHLPVQNMPGHVGGNKKERKCFSTSLILFAFNFISTNPGKHLAYGKGKQLAYGKIGRKKFLSYSTF
jgi:hypothetical protein